METVLNVGGRINIALAGLAVFVCVADLKAQEFSRWSAFCQDVGHTAAVALGDLDGDEDLDVIFANGRHVAESDWVYLNDGRGTFYGRRRLESQPDRSYAIALGDLDGNGTLDAVVANDAGNRSIVYRNDAGANFLPMAGLGSGALTEGRRAVALGDLDADGDLDVILVGDGQDHIYLNHEGGTIWSQRPLSSVTARALSVAVDDFDADGDADIVVAYRRPGRIVAYRNDGRAGFSEGQTLGSGRSDPTGLAVGDLNGDAVLDLVAVNWERTHTVYLNDGQGRFLEPRPFGSEKEQAWSVALGDIDLDGDLDAVVGGANLGWWYDDFEGDGTPDRFGNEARSVPSRVYVNDGSGNLTPGVRVSAGNDDTRPIALGDLDGDGDLDIVMGNDCQPNHVFFNSLRPTLPR